jgi:hypothetical protein
MNNGLEKESPWNGYPDIPWSLNGYTLDDAICDHIMMSKGNYDGQHFDTAEQALESLLQQVRSRRFDL